MVICASNPKPIADAGIPAKGTIFVSEWLESVRKRQLSEYTVMGRGLSIRSDIAKKISIPEGLIAIDLFIQNKVLEMGLYGINPIACSIQAAKLFVILYHKL